MNKLGDQHSLQHQMFRVRHTELNEIFFVMCLRSFICSMISIFVPIYLLRLGYSLRDIFFAHLVMFSAELIFEYVSARVRTEMGPKHAIALSMPFLIAHFWLYSTIQTYHWPLWFPAVCGGIHLALYWQGYHFDFSKSKHRGQATKDVSKINIVLAIVGSLAPFIGGFVAGYFGFPALYAVVIAGIAIVFFPLLRQGEKYHTPKLNLKKLRIREIWRDLISYGGFGLEATTNLVAWPLFVYLIVGSTESVGLITSAALVVTIVITYFVGKRVNNVNRHKYIRYSSFADGALYSLFVFVDTFTQMATLNLVQTAANSFRAAPYTSEYYLHADENSRSEYIYYMESMIDFVKVLVYAFLFGVTYLISDNRILLIVALLVGAIGAIAAGMMPKSKCELPYCSNEGKIKLIPKLRTARETNR